MLYSPLYIDYRVVKVYIYAKAYSYQQYLTVTLVSRELEYCIPFVDIKDLAAIIQELKLQKFDYTIWSELGLYLGLYYEPTLKAIDVNCRGNPMKCLMDCLSAWLKKEDAVKDKLCPSWLALVMALEKLEKRHIAANIKAKYCK